MSIKVMSRVWDTSKLKGSSKLLLLAIADNADEHGVAWPGEDYLAGKIGMSVRHTQRLLDIAESKGELYRKVGNGRGNKTLYLIASGLPLYVIRQGLIQQLEMTSDEANEYVERVTSCPKKGDIFETQKSPDLAHEQTAKGPSSPPTTVIEPSVADTSSLHSEVSVSQPSKPTSDVPQKTEPVIITNMYAYDFKTGDVITQGNTVLGHVGDKVDVGGTSPVVAADDAGPVLSQAAQDCLRYLRDGNVLYEDDAADGGTTTYTYRGQELDVDEVIDLLDAEYIDFVPDEWMHAGHSNGYRITAKGQARAQELPSIVDQPKPHTEPLTLRERAVRALKGVQRSQAAVDMAIDEFNLQMNENEDDLVFREHLINQVLADPTEWVNHCSPVSELFTAEATSAWLAPAPVGYDYLYSTGSEAVVHLVKKGNWEHGKPLCKVSVRFRTEKADGLECLHRPVCADCLRIATAPKPEKKPRTKAPQPYDVWGEAIARNLFGAKDKAGVNAVYGRVAPILHGDKRSGRCSGLIAYECERQGKDKADLDYAALATDTDTFWKDYRRANPDCQLKDCAKVVDAWQLWRGKAKPKVDDGKWEIVEPDMYVSPTRAGGR